MPEYKICFIATERTEYSVSVEAETPEKAFKLFYDPNYDRGEYHEESFLGIESEDDVEIEGEWIADRDKSMNSFRLIRYDESIKYKNE